jgi:hypothetical protein
MCGSTAGPVVALASGFQKFKEPPMKGVLRDWKKNIYTQQIRYLCHTVRFKYFPKIWEPSQVSRRKKRHVASSVTEDSECRI